MSAINYFSIAGEESAAESGAKACSVKMDGTKVKDGLWSEALWYKSDCAEEGMYTHESDELLVFIGGNIDDPENLNAEIELWLENDKLILKNTCAVFIPAGCAHGNMKIRSMSRPVFSYSFHLNDTEYKAVPAKATVPAGKYAGNVVERYEPPSGIMPEAPEGFLKFLLYVDGQRLEGAPYLEAVWFRTVNNTGPAAHSHEQFDEIIGFVGMDPENPGDLGGEIGFDIEGEMVSVKRSCLVYLPRGVVHSPIIVPGLERPFIHFSIGNCSDYVRKAPSEE